MNFRTVTLISTTDFGKDLISASIPSEVSCNGETFLVTDIVEKVFKYTEHLEHLRLPENIKSMRDYELSATKLTSIVIPDGTLSIAYNGLAYCYDLISVSLPSTLTYIGNSAFDRCKSLPSLTIPNGISSIGSFTFSGCDKMSTIILPETVELISSYAFSDSGFRKMSIPSKCDYIGSYAFYNNAGLSLIEFNDRMRWIGRDAFQNTYVETLSLIFRRNTMEEVMALQYYPWGTNLNTTKIYAFGASLSIMMFDSSKENGGEFVSTMRTTSTNDEDVILNKSEFYDSFVDLADTSNRLSIYNRELYYCIPARHIMKPITSFVDYVGNNVYPFDENGRINFGQMPIDYTLSVYPEF